MVGRHSPAIARFSGYGIPCETIVDSSATTARPSASASATSGETTTPPVEMAHDDGEARASTPSGSSSSSFELVAIASFEEGDAAAVGDRTSDAEEEEEGEGGERWCASDATRRDDRVARSISPGVDASGRRRLIILKVYLRVCV